jgi:hypothetical protein
MINIGVQETNLKQIRCQEQLTIFFFFDIEQLTIL